MKIVEAIADALQFAFGMTWEVLWALILGFALSSAVQAVVSKQQMQSLLPDDSPRTLAVAAGLGAASSSCSYASVALARSLFRKGANFTAAMAFQFASTNLVVELGIILAVLIGWRFTAAEFLGGPHAAFQLGNRVGTPHPLRDQQAGSVHREHRHAIVLRQLLDGLDVLADRFAPDHQLDPVVAEPGRILERGLGPQRIDRGRRQADFDCWAHCSWVTPSRFAWIVPAVPR